MYKKLKMWMCRYEIKELKELQKKYLKALTKIVEQNEEIENLKKRIIYLTKEK